MQDAIRNRFDALIKEGNRLLHQSNDGVAQNSEHAAECIGWLTQASHLVGLVSSSKNSIYRSAAEEGLKLGRMSRNLAPERVNEVTSILVRLQSDIEAGLLGSITDRATGETFDNFLDHAEEYLKVDRKNEAAVIAGVVFEDTIRRICAKNGIPEDKVKLDDLISILTKEEVITNNKAKRARQAAGLRTSAAHARWDEFDRGDVRPAIDLTRELIGGHLDPSFTS